MSSIASRGIFLSIRGRYEIEYMMDGKSLENIVFKALIVVEICGIEPQTS